MYSTPLLTIGITSYNRVKELRRCIKSIKTRYTEDIEILVSEDKSPLSAEISEMVKELSQKSDYKIIFTSNEKNLGYDMNLGSIIKKSNGKYIFLLSDDDAIADDCLDEIIEYIKTEPEQGVMYGSFIHTKNGKKDRIRGKNHAIAASEESAQKNIYDSILFSGLIFRKDYAEKYDSSRFLNKNYFQVYLFLEMLLHFGGYYFEKVSVLCIGDGENAFGISESSGGNERLANRKSIISIIEYNKTLIEVIEMFDQDEKTNIMRSFARQYSMHSYGGLSRARKEGINYFQQYWHTLKELKIKKYPIMKMYYIILFILGKAATDKLMAGFIKIVKKER